MMIPGIGMNLYLYIELFYMSYFLTDVCNFSLGMTTLILTSTAAVDLVWVFVTGVMIEKAQFSSDFYHEYGTPYYECGVCIF